MTKEEIMAMVIERVQERIAWTDWSEQISIMFATVVEVFAELLADKKE